MLWCCNCTDEEQQKNDRIWIVWTHTNDIAERAKKKTIKRGLTKTGKKSIRFALHCCFLYELIPLPHIAHCTVQVIDHWKAWIVEVSFFHLLVYSCVCFVKLMRDRTKHLVDFVEFIWPIGHFSIWSISFHNSRWFVPIAKKNFPSDHTALDLFLSKKKIVTLSICYENGIGKVS